MSGPLNNLRILDLSRILAGPWSSQLLGDYGADIVKVERPGVGDDTRAWGPPWWQGSPEVSAYFLSANRNKRSLAVDLAEPQGQELIRSLAVKADVLIENFRVGTMARFNLGPSELCALNPRLIYCSVSAFGQSGSRSKEPGLDAMIQASAGLMSITGAADADGGSPQKVGVAVSDIMAGMYATTAILAAVHARHDSGKGQHIDVPLYDSQVAWLANQNMNYLISGVQPERMGTAHPNIVPYQTFSTADEPLVLAVANDRQFRHCCEGMQIDELADDPRFGTAASRVENRDALVALLQSRFSEGYRNDWLRVFREKAVPAGPVKGIAEVLSDEHAVERGLVRQLQDAAGNEIPSVSNPVDFSATPVEYRYAPPSLGQHTNEVLRDWLGYSDAEIERLRKHDIIQ